MAQTVTFSGGNFDITDTPGGGTQQLTVVPSNLDTQSGVPSYTLINSNPKAPIVGLGFQDNSTTGVTLTLASKTAVSTEGSTLTFGTGNDTLLIGRSINSLYQTGDGTNTVTFQYASTNDTVNTGAGVDTIVFGGKVTGTLVQLLADNSADTIKIAALDTPTTGLRITGATNLDTLIIGTGVNSTYNYTGNGNWTNAAGDTRNYG